MKAKNLFAFTYGCIFGYQCNYRLQYMLALMKGPEWNAFYM